LRNVKDYIRLAVYVHSFIRSVDGECLVSRLGLLYPRGNIACAFWIWGWMRPVARLQASEKTKIFRLCHNSPALILPPLLKRATPVFLLYRVSLRSSQQTEVISLNNIKPLVHLMDRKCFYANVPSIKVQIPSQCSAPKIYCQDSSWTA